MENLNSRPLKVGDRFRHHAWPTFCYYELKNIIVIDGKRRFVMDYIHEGELYKSDMHFMGLSLKKDYWFFVEPEVKKKRVSGFGKFIKKVEADGGS